MAKTCLFFLADTFYGAECESLIYSSHTAYTLALKRPSSFPLLHTLLSNYYKSNNNTRASFFLSVRGWWLRPKDRCAVLVYNNIHRLEAPGYISVFDCS